MPNVEPRVDVADVPRHPGGSTSSTAARSPSGGAAAGAAAGGVVAGLVGAAIGTAIGTAVGNIEVADLNTGAKILEYGQDEIAQSLLASILTIAGATTEGLVVLLYAVHSRHQAVLQGVTRCRTACCRMRCTIARIVRRVLAAYPQLSCCHFSGRPPKALDAGKEGVDLSEVALADRSSPSRERTSLSSQCE
jgi:hypothetical protein